MEDDYLSVMFRLWQCKRWKGKKKNHKTNQPQTQLALRWSLKKIYALIKFCVVGACNSVMWAQRKDSGGPSDTCMRTEEASTEEEKGRKAGGNKQSNQTTKRLVKMPRTEGSLLCRVGGPCSKKSSSRRYGRLSANQTHDFILSVCDFPEPGI